jgi:hypothetical protein
MNIKDLQLECIKTWADKTLSFWCQLLRHTEDGLTQTYYIIWPWTHSKRWISSMPFGSMDLEFNEDMISKSSWDWYEIIWHPITRSRLCYIQSTRNSKDTPTRYKLKELFEIKNSLYNQTILEWDEETINLVREFLLSIQ